MAGLEHTAVYMMEDVHHVHPIGRGDYGQPKNNKALQQKLATL